MGKRGPKPKGKEVIWSPDLAYVTGLITTDGCLSSDQRHLSLVSKDQEQLEHVRDILGLKVKIGAHQSGRRRPNESCQSIQWGDVTFYDFLLSIGLMPAKSKRMGALLVPDEFFFDFLRGHHDGDGSFYSYFDPRWKSSFMFYLSFISASAPHITWLQETVQRLSGVKGHRVYTGREGHKIHSIRYAKAEALQILKKMYPNQGLICLSRKRLKIEEALRIVGLSLPGARKNSAK